MSGSLHDKLYGSSGSKPYFKHQVWTPRPPTYFKQESFFFYVFCVIFVFFLLWILKKSFGKIFAEQSQFRDHLLKKHRKPNESSVDKEKKKKDTESKGEKAAKVALHRIFKVEFGKIRPDFLRNKVTNKNLELDLFNEKLMLAVEVQGRQHYEYVPFFHNNNYAVFRNQQYRDEIKRMICEKEGINLIEVPYTVQPEDMEHYLRVKALELGFEI
jgi:hypothetical protein